VGRVVKKTTESVGGKPDGKTPAQRNLYRKMETSKSLEVESDDSNIEPKPRAKKGSLFWKKKDPENTRTNSHGVGEKKSGKRRMVKGKKMAEKRGGQSRAGVSVFRCNKK